MTSAQTNDVLIEVDEVTKSVKLNDTTIEILRPISFDIKVGESVAIVGESGSGKSTLLGILAGLDLPSSGSVKFKGQALERLNEDDRAALRRGSVGFVFQSFQLLPALTALENVALPLELFGVADGKEQAQALLERVGLGHRLGHYPKQLSGGEQQRVAIARAFSSDADILFADEPTGNLDTETGHNISNLLFELNQEQLKALVLVTHDLVLAERCDRSITLSAGKIVVQSNSRDECTEESSGSESAR